MECEIYTNNSSWHQRGSETNSNAGKITGGLMKQKRQLDSKVLQNLCVYVSTDHVFMGLNLNFHSKGKLSNAVDSFSLEGKYGLWCSILYYIPQTILLKKPECGIIIFILSECCIEIIKCISQWQVKELGVLIQTEQHPKFW